MNRGERRREERAQAKRRGTVLIAGEGLVAAALGTKYEATGHAELPDKVTGQHRWVATAAYVVKTPDVKGAFDPEHLTFLDNENLMNLSLGCWDCELPLGAIEVGSNCTGEPDA